MFTFLELFGQEHKLQYVFFFLRYNFQVPLMVFYLINSIDII